MAWFAVRCIFEIAEGQYEERITLWSCESFEEAIQLAEREAAEYVADVEIRGYVGLAQAYALAEEPASGSEIFSLIRRSPMSPQEYVSSFFDTGNEVGH